MKRQPATQSPASPVRPLWKKLAANLAVLAAATLLTLAAVELVLRVTGFASTDWYSGGPGDRALDQSAQSNTHGFRDRDYPLTPAPGTARIIVLGDSFAWGAGVFDDKAIFPALLEEKLDTPEHPVQLLNAARKGAHTWKELDLYRRAHLEFKPGLVILVYFVNDVESPNNSGLFDPLVEPALPGIPRALREHSFLFHLLELRVRLLQERTHRRMDYTGYMHALYRDPGTLALHQRAMDYLNEEVRKDGAQLVIVNMPMLHPGKYAFDAATRHIRSQARRLDAPFIDLRPTLYAYDPVSLRVSKYDGHLNARGHAIVAEFLARELEPLVRETANRKQTAPDPAQ